VKNSTLTLQYIPLDQAALWDDNPKTHDLDAILARRANP
jgi:hypothetical protein